MELGASYTENGVSFSPPAYVQRYGAVCDLIKDDPRWSGTIQKVVDFGCAELSLFYYLKNIGGLTDVLEVDYDGDLLERFHSRAEPLFYDHLFQRQTPFKVSVLQGSVSDPDYRLIGCDAVIAIELIEHLDVGVFDRLPHNIFGYIKPRIAIVTTPNADFNVLFPNLKDGGYRHYDHRFEWTREQFEDWANNIVSRYPDYTVEVSGLAPGPEGSEHLGCCSQMAVFVNQNYTKMDNVDPATVNLDYSGALESKPRIAAVGTDGGAGEKFKQNSDGGSTQQWNCDPSPSCNIPSKPDRQVDLDVSPPCSVTSDDPLDENENQNKLEYRDFLGADTSSSHVARDTSPASSLQWDCKVWENETPAKYYNSVAEYEYPVYVDPRSREQKIVDDVKYKITSYCNYQHQYYDSDEDLWRIPMPYLLSLCHEYPDLTIEELRMILYNAGYEVDTETLIHRINYGGSSCQSEEPHYEDNYQGDVAEENYDHQENWDFSCPSDTNVWSCTPVAEGVWNAAVPDDQQVYPLTDICTQPYAAADNQTFIPTDDNLCVEQMNLNKNKSVHKETNALYANERLTLHHDNDLNKDSSAMTIDSRVTFTDSNETQTTLAKDVSCTSEVSRKQNSAEDKGSWAKERTNKFANVEQLSLLDKTIESCATFKSGNTYTIHCSANTVCPNNELSQTSHSDGKSSASESVTRRDESVTNEAINENNGVSKTNESNSDKRKSTSKTDECRVSLHAESKSLYSGNTAESIIDNKITKTNETHLSLHSESDSPFVRNNDASNVDKRISKTSESRASSHFENNSLLSADDDSYLTIDSQDSFTDSNDTQTTLAGNAAESLSNVEPSEERLGIIDLIGEQLDVALAGKLEDSCSLSCMDERSPSSPLAQFCNASKDKDGTEMLSDSGYLKSQDSPQSPICSESFSNDLITPDKDVSEMLQSTMLECIPENLNYVTQNSPSPKGSAKSSPLRRKSIGPMTTSESNEEFSGCSSMSRPRSLHVCTTTNADVDHGDFKTDTRFRAVLYESPTNSVPQQFIGPRNEANNRPGHRHFNVLGRQMNNYEEQRPEQHRPNFLDLQNLEVAVLDHQNNNVDFEGNNIDEDERVGGAPRQEEELDAADLMRQRMDIHNENHLAGGPHHDDNEEEDRGEIVEEYREPCQGENYGCNPNILPPRFATPQNIAPASAVVSSTHSVSCHSNVTQTDEEHDTNILIDSIEKTLSLQSNDNIFLDESPCCSKTFYNATHDRYNIDKNMPSTSKKYTSNDSFNLERKKTGHCLTTMLYNPDDFKKIYNRDSDVSLNELNSMSMTNLYKEPGLSHSNLISSKDSSDCNIVESKDTDLGLEGCLTIIGSHLNKCFSSSGFLDWKNTDVNLSDEDSIIDLDVRNEVTDYASEENILEPLIVPVEKKPAFSSNIDLDAIVQGSTGSPGSSSSRLDQFFSLEEQFVLPDWFVQIMTNNPEFDDEMMSAAAMVFAPMERQAGGDGVGVHSYPSTHSSGHASMSSAASHTNQSVVVPMDRQAYSFTDIPYFQPPVRDNYETSSSDSSIDLQLPIDLVQDTRVATCQCDYCQTNNSDNVSHHNYTCTTGQEDNECTATSRLNYNYHLANALQQQEYMQDSSDDTYQSHSYRNSQIAAAEINCSSPENNLDVKTMCQDESQQQPNSLLDLPDDLTFRNVDSYNDYQDVKSLGSCEFFKINDHSSRSARDNVALRGVPSDMSGNYADIETDLDSETD